MDQWRPVTWDDDDLSSLTTDSGSVGRRDSKEDEEEWQNESFYSNMRQEFGLHMAAPAPLLGSRQRLSSKDEAMVRAQLGASKSKSDHETERARFIRRFTNSDEPDAESLPSCWESQEAGLWSESGCSESQIDFDFDPIGSQGPIEPEVAPHFEEKKEDISKRGKGFEITLLGGDEEEDETSSLELDMSSPAKEALPPMPTKPSRPLVHGSQPAKIDHDGYFGPADEGEKTHDRNIRDSYDEEDPSAYASGGDVTSGTRSLTMDEIYADLIERVEQSAIQNSQRSREQRRSSTGNVPLESESDVHRRSGRGSTRRRLSWGDLKPDGVREARDERQQAGQPAQQVPSASTRQRRLELFGLAQPDQETTPRDGTSDVQPNNDGSSKVNGSHNEEAGAKDRQRKESTRKSNGTMAPENPHRRGRRRRRKNKESLAELFSWNGSSSDVFLSRNRQQFQTPAPVEGQAELPLEMVQGMVVEKSPRSVKRQVKFPPERKPSDGRTSKPGRSDALRTATKCPNEHPPRRIPRHQPPRQTKSSNDMSHKRNKSRSPQPEGQPKPVKSSSLQPPVRRVASKSPKTRNRPLVRLPNEVSPKRSNKSPRQDAKQRVVGVPRETSPKDKRRSPRPESRRHEKPFQSPNHIDAVDGLGISSDDSDEEGERPDLDKLINMFNRSLGGEELSKATLDISDR